MRENRLGMRSGPAVGEHFFQTFFLRMEAEKKVADVGPRFNAVTLGASQDRVQHGGSWAGSFTAQEEPILTTNCLVQIVANSKMALTCLVHD